MLRQGVQHRLKHDDCFAAAQNTFSHPTASAYCRSGPSVVPVCASRKYKHFSGSRHYSAYRRECPFPSAPNDSMCTIAGIRHYDSTGSREGSLLYQVCATVQQWWFLYSAGLCSSTASVVPPKCLCAHYRGKYRHYVGNRHYTAYCHYWWFPSVSSDFTGTNRY